MAHYNTHDIVTALKDIEFGEYIHGGVWFRHLDKPDQWLHLDEDDHSIIHLHVTRPQALTDMSFEEFRRHMLNLKYEAHHDRYKHLAKLVCDEHANLIKEGMWDE